MVKAELDDHDLLTMREREASLAAFETVAALKGELQEARAEIQAWKSSSEADKAELKSSQKEVERHLEALRGAHAVAKGLEKEKFALMKRNYQLEHSEANLQDEVKKLKAELELKKSKLCNGVLLEEAFRKHPDFDGFAKDFSDAGFRFGLWK